MSARHVSFLHTHKRTLVALLFGLAFSATLAYAVPPTSPYLPSDQQLDPGCAPTDTNCTVSIPSSQWNDVTGGINYAGGRVGIGTTTPTTALDVVGTITGSNLNIVGDATIVPAPTNLSAIQTQICASGCNYTADGASGAPINYHVYSYKTVGAGRIYSSSYATLSSDFVDDGSNNPYDVTVSWTAAPGADGYRVLVYSPNYLGANYDAGYDTTSTSFVDDGGNSTAFDPGLTVVMPTSGYSNVAAINGQVTISGDIALNGKTIIGGNGTTFTVDNTSTTFTFTNGNVTIGNLGGGGSQMVVTDNDGLLSTQAIPLLVWGSIGGTLSDQGDLQSVLNTKFNVPAGNTSQYIRGDGTLATYNISPVTVQNTTSLFSTGLSGTGSGSSAIDSLFLLTNSGNNARNASNSIFLGRDAGLNDTVNNTATYNNSSTFADTSILIGQSTSTGGFSNSIALGAYATNTAENQLIIGSTKRFISSVFIGSNKGTASTQGTIFIGPLAGENATNALASIFLGSFAGENATNASFSNLIGQSAGDGAISASNSNFFGQNAGASASNASNSNFFGENAGSGATNSSSSVFIGENAGSVINGPSIFLGSSSASNSIFIGKNAGFFNADRDLNNTGSPDDFSILLGQNTSTGGFSNSIAIGSSAVNTAANQFVIGSTIRPIDSTIFYGTGGTSCTITTGTSMSCSSDERLKTNIADLTTDTLDTLFNVRTVSYNWKVVPDGNKMVGFLAQDLQKYFPQLVSNGPGDYLQVNYAGMTPILVEAIREMNLKIIDINDLTKDNSWRSALTEWFASATNGITSFFAGEVTTKTLCVADDSGAKTCLTKSQLDTLLNDNTSTVIINTPPQAPDPTPTPDSTPVSDPTPTEPVVETPTPDPVPVVDPVPTEVLETPAQ